MRKIALAVLTVAVTAACVWAEEGFYASKKGMTLVAAASGPDGKITGYARSTVKDVKGSGANVQITYTATALDANKKPHAIPPYEFTMNIVNGEAEVDMSNLMPGGMSVKTTGGKMTVPAKMAAGDKFKDVNMSMEMTMDAGSGPIQAATKIAVRDYKCVAVESVKTPAGTFTAYKTSYRMEMAMELMGNAMPPVTSTAVTWQVRGIGAVKTVIYDANNKVASVVELHELIK